MNFYFVARLSISPSRRILVYSAKNGIRTRTDIPVQKIFSPHLLLHKPTWLSSRCGPAHFSTILKMLRNSNRIVISCIKCLNVMPHGYFQLRCFLYVLYAIYDYDYTYVILCNLFLRIVNLVRRHQRPSHQGRGFRWVREILLPTFRMEHSNYSITANLKVFRVYRFHHSRI